MRLSFVSAAVLALSSTAFAQTPGFDPMSSPTQDQQVPAGSKLDIVWEPSTIYTGSVTITLLQGASMGTLQLGDKITTVDNSVGKFTYQVPSSSSFNTYGFQISLDSDPKIFQYSFPFHITGGSSSATGTSTTTTTMTLAPNPSYTSSTSTVTADSTSTVSSSSTSSTVSTGSTSSSTLRTITTSSTSTTAGSSSGLASRTSAAASVTSSAASATATNAAAGNVASGGVAVFGGLVLALAL